MFCLSLKELVPLQILVSLVTLRTVASMKKIAILMIVYLFFSSNIYSGNNFFWQLFASQTEANVRPLLDHSYNIL